MDDLQGIGHLLRRFYAVVPFEGLRPNGLKNRGWFVL